MGAKVFSKNPVRSTPVHRPLQASTSSPTSLSLFNHSLPGASRTKMEDRQTTGEGDKKSIKLSERAIVAAPVKKRASVRSRF